MIMPRIKPDYWIAHGIDTTAEPIMVFQQEKIITIDEAFVGILGSSAKGLCNRT